MGLENLINQATTKITNVAAGLKTRRARLKPRPYGIIFYGIILMNNMKGGDAYGTVPNANRQHVVRGFSLVPHNIPLKIRGIKGGYDAWNRTTLKGRTTDSYPS